MSHEGLQLCYEEALTRPTPVLRLTRGGLPLAASHASVSATAASVHSDGRMATVNGDGSSTPVHPPAAHHGHAAASGVGSGTGASASASASGVAATAAARSALWYNLGTHFLWIGDRTRQIDHAHIEYFRGIQNPVGIKAGPSSDPAELVALIRRLWPNPKAAPGKIVLITRMGASNVRSKLPGLISAVQAADFSSPVVWTCDPMHGNTKVSSNNYKTREFDDILAELK
jgi:3-deoxy-D-arabino-heptulosonate 7-phosphate (DAHP) synthase class II